MTLSLSRAVAICARPAVLFASLLLFWQAASAPLARATSPNVVISQVYGGGGGDGATYNPDFVELFNRGASPVSVTGWSVQYQTQAGTTWSAVALTGTIPAGGYYLVQMSNVGANGVALPTPNASASPNLNAAQGKVALVSAAGALTSQCDAAAPFVDRLGYGTTSTICREGAANATAPVGNAASMLRANGGCTDTDANSADFATGPPNPRNASSPPAPCGAGDAAPGVSSSTPANAATNVPVNSSIIVEFSEPVTAPAAAFSLVCAGSARSFALSGGGTSFTLDPDADLPGGASCTVTVLASQVTDIDTADPPDHMDANHSFSFSTLAPDVPPVVSSTTPANGASNVSINSTVSISFSETVTASATAFALECPGGASQTFTQSASPAARSH